MKKALKFLLENGLTEKGLNWNQKVYGNAIYLNGEKVVLHDGEILELAKRRFEVYLRPTVEVRNNLIFCNSEKIPFTIEDTKNAVKNILEHHKIDATTAESIKEIEETVIVRQAEAFNTLVNGINFTGMNALLTNEEKKAKFDELCSFVMA